MSALARLALSSGLLLRRSLMARAAEPARSLASVAAGAGPATLRSSARVVVAGLQEQVAAYERLMREQQERLAEQRERLAAAEQTTQDRLAEHRERLAAAERTAQERVAEQRERLAAAERSAQERVAAAERTAQERVAAAEKTTQERVAEHCERLAAAERTAQERVAEQRERLAAAERTAQERLAEQRERVAEKQDQLAAEARAHAGEVARLKHAVDVTKGVLASRAFFEASLDDAWRISGGKPGATRTEQLKALLSVGREARCPGLVAYLKVAASDNKVAEKDVLSAAERLFQRLSERVHSEAAAGTTALPVEVFDPSGRAFMVALAAFARFTGRDIALYALEGGHGTVPVQLQLRALAANTPACTVTEEQLRKAPFVTS